MKDRALLLTYLAAVVAASVVHDPLWLGLALVTVLASSGRGAWALTRRVLLAALPFAVAVALGWMLAEGADWRAALTTPLRLGLRVLLMTALAFRVLPLVSLPRALSFSQIGRAHV